MNENQIIFSIFLFDYEAFYKQISEDSNYTERELSL